MVSYSVGCPGPGYWNSIAFARRILQLLLFAANLTFVIDVSVAAVAVAESYDDGLEPPMNPFLAVDSPWPMTHRNPYCQQSTLYAGPTSAEELDIEMVYTAPGSSTLCYSTPPNANRNKIDNNESTILWNQNPFFTTKLQRKTNLQSTIKVVDKLYNITLDVLSQAYYLLDHEGVFFSGRNAAIRAFASANSNDDVTNSKIVKLREFALPSTALVSRKDSLVGLNLLYDGYLVYTTAHGMVGTLSRNFTDHHFLLLGNGTEKISNMMAVDDDGGIYIVTSAKMYRVNWNGLTLSIAWSVSYETGRHRVGGRLGEGSGTTPTLMGTRDGDDKLVLITDGAPLMNIIAYWRDDIPNNWQPVRPGMDIRIAAQQPITFGNFNAKTSETEQSVVVRGYGALVVNNDYGFPTPSWTPDFIHQALVLFTNLPWFVPYGVEKFIWDPTSRQFITSWSNRDVSCPNGVPAMSATTNMIYCIGSRNMKWNLEALDWTTGESLWHKELGYWPIYNSAYSTLNIGMDGEIISGTAVGIVRFKKREREREEERDQIER